MVTFSSPIFFFGGGGEDICRYFTPPPKSLFSMHLVLDGTLPPNKIFHLAPLAPVLRSLELFVPSLFYQSPPEDEDGGSEEVLSSVVPPLADLLSREISECERFEEGDEETVCSCLFRYVELHTHTGACTHTHTHTHNYQRTCILYIHMCAPSAIAPRPYAHKHTHTHIHAHTHTHHTGTCRPLLPPLP